MEKSLPIKQLEQLIPDGFALLHPIFYQQLEFMEKSGKPIEEWEKQDWKDIEQSLLNIIRERKDEKAFRKILADHDWQPSKHKMELKAFGRFWDNRKGQALRSLEMMRKRIAQATPHVRESYYLQIKEWQKTYYNPNIPLNKRTLLLAELSDDKFYKNTPSDHHSVQLAQVLQSGDNFKETTSEGFPVAKGTSNVGRENEKVWQWELVPPEVINKREGVIESPLLDINMPRLRQEMAKYAEKLSDRDSDLLTYLMAMFADKANSQDDKCTITINEVMEALGYKKHQGGKEGASYKAEEKREVCAQVNKLQNNWLTVKQPRGRDTKETLSSRVFVIWDSLGQEDLNGYVAEWSRITFGFHRVWSSTLFDNNGLGKLVMHLQKQALKYHPTKEFYEKRLTKSFGFWWKINIMKGRSTRTLKTRELWEQVIAERADELDRRKAERLDLALDRLKVDEIIGDWRYVDGVKTSEMTTFKKGWQLDWFNKEVEIEAPRDLRLIYEKKKIEDKTERQRKNLKPNETIGAEFRAFRQARQISGIEASKLFNTLCHINIRNDTLSRYEMGSRTPNAEVTKAMQEFMKIINNRPDLLNEIANK
jgi:ribosome-binding protein aMBF1 (putative translation factor)